MSLKQNKTPTMLQSLLPIAVLIILLTGSLPESLRKQRTKTGNLKMRWKSDGRPNKAREWVF